MFAKKFDRGIYGNSVKGSETMEYIIEVTADLSGVPGVQKIIAKQGDDGTRKARVKLLSGGTQYYPPEGTRARIGMRKPNDQQVYHDANIDSEGSVLVEFDSRMLDTAGEATLEIVLYLGNATLSSAIVTVLIYPSAYDIHDLSSSDEYQALIDALAASARAGGVAQEAADKANAAAQYATETADTAALYAKETTDAAAKKANDIAEDLTVKLKNGEFHGRDGIDGKDGVIAMTSGQFALRVENGRLILYHPVGETPPDMQIVDGHLKWAFGKNEEV